MSWSEWLSETEPVRNHHWLFKLPTLLQPASKFALKYACGLLEPCFASQRTNLIGINHHFFLLFLEAVQTLHLSRFFARAPIYGATFLYRLYGEETGLNFLSYFLVCAPMSLGSLLLTWVALSAMYVPNWIYFWRSRPDPDSKARAAQLANRIKGLGPITWVTKQGRSLVSVTSSWVYEIQTNELPVATSTSDEPKPALYFCAKLYPNRRRGNRYGHRSAGPEFKHVLCCSARKEFSKQEPFSQILKCIAKYYHNFKEKKEWPKRFLSLKRLSVGFYWLWNSAPSLFPIFLESWKGLRATHIR